MDRKYVKPTPNERGHRETFPESTNAHTQGFKTRKLTPLRKKKKKTIYACRETSFRHIISMLRRTKDVTTSLSTIAGRQSHQVGRLAYWHGSLQSEQQNHYRQLPEHP